MDFLQIALVLLILLLGVMLSILGLQVFFILKDLRRSLDKLDNVLDNATEITEDLEKPARAAAEVTQAMETGVKAVRSLAKAKTAKRLFRRR